MTRAPLITLALAALVLTMACGDVPTETQVTPLSPQFAKVKTCPGHPSCKQGPTSVIVEYPFDAQSSGMRIYGDGLVDPETDPFVTYEPGVCGVYSRLFVDGSGDAVMDPDGNYKRGDGDCLLEDDGHERRFIVLDYSVCAPETPDCEVLGRREGSWFMNVFNVHGVTEMGVVVSRGAQFNTGQCAHGLRFDFDEDPLTSNVLVQLIGSNPRIWDVWTEWPHVAVCRPDEHGKKPTEGRRYFSMPFSLELEEVLPSP